MIASLQIMLRCWGCWILVLIASFEVSNGCPGLRCREIQTVEGKVISFLPREGDKQVSKLLAHSFHSAKSVFCLPSDITTMDDDSNLLLDMEIHKELATLESPTLRKAFRTTVNITTTESIAKPTDLRTPEMGLGGEEDAFNTASMTLPSPSLEKATRISVESTDISALEKTTTPAFETSIIATTDGIGKVAPSDSDVSNGCPGLRCREIQTAEGKVISFLPREGDKQDSKLLANSFHNTKSVFCLPSACLDHQLIVKTYRGTMSQTVTGRTCQKWTASEPHNPNFTPEDHGEDGLGDHNYCRSPGSSCQLWCYTTDPDRRWDFCALGIKNPACQQIYEGFTSDCDPNDLSGLTYRGNISSTLKGKTCQKWTEQTPHSHAFTPEAYPFSGLGPHNFCRNPDCSSRSSAWCYTIDPDLQWDYCAVGIKNTKCKY